MTDRLSDRKPPEPGAYCLRFGYGLCPECRNGFPQWCQCGPNAKKKAPRHVR